MTYWTVPFAKLLLESIPVIKLVPFLPMPVAQLLLCAGLVPLEALRITKCTTFGTPRLIHRIGVHLDRLERWKRFEWEDVKVRREEACKRGSCKQMHGCGTTITRVTCLKFWDG
jgi:hypothetical protein